MHSKYAWLVETPRSGNIWIEFSSCSDCLIAPPRCDSRLFAYILAHLRNPPYSSARKHLQRGLTLIQIHALGLCKQSELQTPRIRIRRLNDADGTATFGTHRPLHGVARASLVVHIDLVGPARGADWIWGVGLWLKSDVLLGNDKGVRCDSAAAPFARHAVAGQSREGREGLAGDGDLEMGFDPGQPEAKPCRPAASSCSPGPCHRGTGPSCSWTTSARARLLCNCAAVCC